MTKSRATYSSNWRRNSVPRIQATVEKWAGGCVAELQMNGFNPEERTKPIPHQCLALLVIILLLSISSAGGCTANLSPAPSPSSATSSSHSGQLAQKTWVLASYTSETGQQTTLPNTTITATFDNGNITGSAGCNHYSASYQLKGNEIAVSSIASTLMYCASPDGVMIQETTYLQLLKAATSYTLSDGVLTLSSEEGNPQLIFHSES